MYNDLETEGLVRHGVVACGNSLAFLRVVLRASIPCLCNWHEVIILFLAFSAKLESLYHLWHFWSFRRIRNCHVFKQGFDGLGIGHNVLGGR